MGGPGLSASVTVCVLGRSVLSDSVPARALWPARLFCPWGFSREERWSGLPRPPPGDLLDPGIELAPPALAGGFFTPELPRKPNAACKSSVLVKGEKRPI